MPEHLGGDDERSAERVLSAMLDRSGGRNIGGTMGGHLALRGLFINNVCCTGIAITSDKSRAKVRDVHVYPRSVARSLSASESCLFLWAGGQARTTVTRHPHTANSAPPRARHLTAP